MSGEAYGSIVMCALDFARALLERNRFYRWLFRIAVGKYAYREYEIMCAILDGTGHHTDFCYGLEDADYHKKSIEEIRRQWQEGGAA